MGGRRCCCEVCLSEDVNQTKPKEPTMSKKTNSDDADMPMFHRERARQCEQEREQSRLTPADGGALDDAAKWLLMATEELDELDGLLSGGSGRRQKELLTSISYALFEAHAAV